MRGWMTMKSIIKNALGEEEAGEMPAPKPLGDGNVHRAMRGAGDEIFVIKDIKTGKVVSEIPAIDVVVELQGASKDGLKEARRKGFKG